MRTLLTLCSLATLSVPALAQIPRTAVETDGLFFSDLGSAIATSPGGTVAMLFKDVASATDDLYIVSSQDGGLSWSPPVLISITPRTKFVQADSIFIIGTDAYCGWTVETGPTPPPDAEEDFAFCIVDVSGPVPVVTSPEILVAPSAFGFAAGQIRDYEFECCRSPLGVNVAFLSNFDFGPINGPDQAWVVAAPASGPFTPPVPLSPPPPLDCDSIALACDGEAFAAVWDDNGPAGGAALDTLFLSVNPAGGMPPAWTAPIMVNAALADDIEDDVDVSLRGSKIFVAWLHEIGGAGAEHPFGRTFALAGPVPIGPQLPLHGLIPAGDGDEIRCRISSALNPVAFFDYDTAGPDTIFVARSKDCGTLTYLPEIPLSIGEGSFIESTAGPDGVVAATWSGFPSGTGDRAETAVSCDDGCTWILKNANTTGADSDFGCVAYDPLKRNVIVGFQADPGGANSSFAGGFSVCTPSSVVSRNGGTNPPSLSLVGTPVLGGSLDAVVDLTLTGHGVAVLFAFDTPLPGLLLSGGQTLLCIDLGSGELLTGGGKSAPGPLASFSCAIPNDPCLNGFSLCMQAIHAFLVSPFRLSNALDVTIGAF